MTTYHTFYYPHFFLFYSIFLNKNQFISSLFFALHLFFQNNGSILQEINKTALKTREIRQKGAKAKVLPCNSLSLST